MEPAFSAPRAASATNVERRFKKAILRLVKGGPERLAIEAGQIDSIIDPSSGCAILLPEAQRAIIERKAGLRSLIGVAFDWYWEQDECYRFVSHHAATDDADGFAAEDFIGKALWDLPANNMSEADRQMHCNQLEWRVRFRDLEIKRTDRAGKERYLSLSGEPIFDERIRFKGYRGITRDITQRKQAEALMQEPHRYARAILDALGTPIAVLDNAGAVLSANQAWRTFADSHTDAAIGAAVGVDFLAACDRAAGTEPVDAMAITAGIRQVIARKRALFRYDFPCHSFDGPAHFTLSVTGVSGNGPAHAVVACEDITDRKRGELLLRLDFNVARCIADANTAAVALQSVIRTMCETQGWDCGRYFCLDQTAGLLRHAESWGVPTPEVRQFLELSRGMAFRPGAGLAGRVFQSGQPIWTLKSTQGDEVSSTALAPETGENGACIIPIMTRERVIGVLAFAGGKIREPDDRMLQVLHSIGSQLGQFLQRQQALDALRRSELRFRILNDLSSDWYWEQDCAFRFTQVVGCSAFGSTDILGRTLWDLPNVVLANGGWDEHKSRLAARWSFCDFEFTTLHPDGMDGHYSISGEPVYDEAGALTGYCGTGVDITKRKRAEIALRESEARLRALAGPAADQ